MSHQSGDSQVGDRKAYEADEQRKYTGPEINEASRTHGVNVSGYQDKSQIMDKLQDQDVNAQINERLKHEPGYAATMHGNKPSRGVEIDAELARDDAETLEKMNKKADALASKKIDAASEKSNRK